MKKLRTLFIISLMIAGSYSPLLAPTASAVTAADWQAGRIIDDSKFTGLDMSATDIQNFLISKVPVCDTWGTQPAREYGRSDLTHAQYAAGRGWAAPPYVCLRDYYEVPKIVPGPGVPLNSYNNAGNPPAGSISAAQMIYNAARAHRISPKVLLIKLATESGGPLTTDTWPLQKQYTYAMGAHCPDSGPGGSANCDPNYAGFSIQISEAAALLRYYLDGMTQPWWQYKKPYQVNNILWNVAPTGCGGSNVYLETMGSAALYTYTPYQPNQAALNNMYGTGDGCSAYGNRNFWRVYNDWFGPSRTGILPITVTQAWVSRKEVAVGEHVTVAYTLKNNMGGAITVPSTGINCRIGDYVCDFGVQQNVSLAANESREFVATFTSPKNGAASIRPVYNFVGGWYGAAEYSWVNIHKPSLSITSSIKSAPEFPLVGSSQTMSFTIKNTGTLPAYLDNLMLANLDGTTPRGYKAVSIDLPPGQSYTYSDTRILPNASEQSSWIAYELGDMGWQSLGSTSKYRAYLTPSNLRMISPISTSPAYPVANVATTARFKVKNFGDQPIRLTNIGLGVSRNSDGSRFDLGSQIDGVPGVISGGSEYTYISKRVLPTKDTYTAFVTGSIDGNIWSSELVNEDATNTKTYVFDVYSSAAKLEFSEPIKTQQTSGPLSHIVDVSYTVKNTGDAPTGNITLAFYCRQNTAQYCDIPGRVVNLANNQFATMSKTLGYFSPGTLDFRALKYADGIWQDFGSTAKVDIQDRIPSKADFATSYTLSSTRINLGSSINVTYTVRNNSSADLQVPVYAIASRLNGQFHDFGLQQWFFVRKGETRQFTASFTPPAKGIYKLFPVLQTANSTWYGYNESQLLVE